MNPLRSRVVRWRRPRAALPASAPANYRSMYLHTPMRCHVYWIYVWDPRTNFTTLTLGYVGETAQNPPEKRFLGHLDDKPWADTVPYRDPVEALAKGTLVISQQSYPCKADVVAAETAAIVRDRPLYNYRGNEANPDRVPMWQQGHDRDARDVANGVPVGQRWSDLAPARPQRQTVRTLRLRSRSRRWVSLAAGWAGATVLLWTIVALTEPSISLARTGLLSAGATGLLWTWMLRPHRRRGWKSTGNLALRYLIVFAMLVVLLWPILNSGSQ